MSPIGFTIGTHPKGHWPDGHFPTHHWPGTPDDGDLTPTDDLQHTPCFILGSYLIAEAIVSLPSLGSDWPLYKSALPDGENVEDDAGAIYDTTPMIDRRVRGGFPNTHYGLQIKIRANDYETGKAKASAILSSLQDIQNSEVEFGDYVYEIRAANPTSGIIPLGLEQGTKRRYLFTLNFMTILKYMEAA